MERRICNVITPIELERRENNRELHGLTEKREEDCSEEVKSVLKNVTTDTISLRKCYRFGREDTERNKPRRIFIQFESKEQRDKVFKNRANLRKSDKPLYLNENLPSHLSMLRGKANAKRTEKSINLSG